MLNEIRIFELRIICSNSNSILKIRYSNPTCTKTGVGIEAWLSRNRLRTRRDVLVLCRPLPARRFTRPLTRPPSTLLTFDYPSPPAHLSLLLQSRRAACPLSGCCSQRSLIGITRWRRCVMKRILADTVAIGDRHCVDYRHQRTQLATRTVHLQRNFQLRYSFATCKPFGGGSATVGNQRQQLRRIVAYELFVHSPRTLNLLAIWSSAPLPSHYTWACVWPPG